MENGMVASGNWQSFLNLEGEKLLLVKRRHPFVIITPIIFTILLAFLFIASAYLFFIKLLGSIPLFTSTTLLLVSAGVSIIAKILIDWYFHLYILTTRKIVEVWYTPLASHAVNGIFLDQVNCTEIDIRTNGFFKELLGIGDIFITFDRPTHQEEFVFSNIREANSLGVYLTQQLMDRQAPTTHPKIQTIWFKERGTPNAGLIN